MSEKEPKKETDLFLRAKHVGYCWSNLPPEDDTKLSDFLEYARFVLCIKTKRLMKDPIWQEYSDIEILAEYFAWTYAESDKAREKFEKGLGLEEEMYDWFDRMIEENEKELKEKAGEFEDIEFDASSVMGS